VRRFEILLEMLNRKDLQDLKEEPRSILSSRSLRSSWFIILVLTARGGGLPKWNYTEIRARNPLGLWFLGGFVVRSMPGRRKNLQALNSNPRRAGA